MAERATLAPGAQPSTPLLDERALKAVLGGTPAGVSVSVVRIVDFTHVNGAWGREGGDAVLSAVAERLSGLGEAQARLDGPDFVVVRQDSWAPSLLARLAEPVRVDGDTLRFSVSVGTVTRAAGERAGVTVDRARAAAAAAASDRAIWWGDRVIGDDERLAIDLRRALDHDEIAVLFQPQVDARTGELIGMEALSRWHHAQVGQVTTGHLFAVAGRTAFSAPLTNHIIDRALLACARWPPPLSEVPMGLNVSARDVARSGFAARLIARLQRAAISPSRMVVEITEDAAMDDPVAARRAIAELQGEGAKVVLDDFGTGQSSLAWLAELPVDGIKIDRRFSATAAGGGRAARVVETLVRLAEQLKLSVLAEGVETNEEATALAALGCVRQQGFLYAEPMPADSLPLWLAGRGG